MPPLNRKRWGVCVEVSDMWSLQIRPGLLGSIVVGLLLLLIIAVGPDSLANVVGQIFQLFGRLVGALAGEAEAAASALFGIVRGMFTSNGEPDKSPTEQTAPSRATEPPTSASEGAPQEQSPATATQIAEEDTRFTWVAETFFVRLRYLATVMI